MRIVLLIMVFFLLLPASLALSEQAQRLDVRIEIAYDGLEKLKSDNFTTTRYNDTLIIAQELYFAQRAREDAGEETDYAQVEVKLDELQELKGQAYTASDELNALALTLDETTGINDLTPAFELYNQGLLAFNGERYEESLRLVDQTYQTISELEAFETKLVALYDATTRGTLQFLKRNWEYIVGGVVLAGLIVLLGRKRFFSWITARKIRNLEVRQGSIRKLMARSQRDYFERGAVDENTYHVRTAKYAELMRDLSRQIPVLKEQMARRSSMGTFSFRRAKSSGPRKEKQINKIRTVEDYHPSDVKYGVKPLKSKAKHGQTKRKFKLFGGQKVKPAASVKLKHKSSPKFRKTGKGKPNAKLSHRVKNKPSKTHSIKRKHLGAKIKSKHRNSRKNKASKKNKTSRARTKKLHHKKIHKKHKNRKTARQRKRPWWRF